MRRNADPSTSLETAVQVSRTMLIHLLTLIAKGSIAVGTWTLALLQQQTKKNTPRLLASRATLKLFIPRVTGPCDVNFSNAIQTVTTKKPLTLTITIPKKSDENTQAITPRGSVALCTPTKKTTMTVTAFGNTWEEKLALFTRLPNYYSSDPSDLLKKLDAEPSEAAPVLTITATPDTVKNQPDRKTQKTEKTAVGDSAMDLVRNFLKAKGLLFSNEHVRREQWELCHLLAYLIAKNAIGQDGKPFETQIAENLYAGTRVLNENMFILECVLADLLRSNEIKSIQIQALPTILSDSHILKTLTLKIVIITHKDARLNVDFHFNAFKESRFYPRAELTTCYAAFFRAARDQAHNRIDAHIAAQPANEGMMTTYVTGPLFRALGY